MSERELLQEIREKQEQISEKVDDIGKRLSEGDKIMAVFETRLRPLERIVFGGVGIVLVSAVTAMLALIFRHS